MTKKTIITRDTVGTYDTTDRSLRWWHREARRIFAAHLGVHTVTIAHGGRKTDLLKRGEYVPPPGHYYIIASTCGKWGRPRREWRPRTGQGA